MRIRDKASTDRSSIGRQCAAILLALTLGACSTPAPTTTSVLVEKKEWAVGEGPLVSELVAMPPKTVAQAFNSSPQYLLPRGKFETDQEYAARLAPSRQPHFIVVPISTTPLDNCESRYDHAAGKYIIADCVPFLSGRRAQYLESEGTPMTLPTALGPTTFKRILDNNYYLNVSAGWSQQFTIDRDKAAVLDKDLMAGVVIENPSYDSTGCRQRNWREQALRYGVVHEDKHYYVGAEFISRLVIFRQSDRRVLYDAKFALKSR